MSRRKPSKNSHNVIHDIVSDWTEITDERTIRREVDRWTKSKHKKVMYEKTISA